jgi:hypothetical protein
VAATHAAKRNHPAGPHSFLKDTFSEGKQPGIGRAVGKSCWANYVLQLVDQPVSRGEVFRTSLCTVFASVP